MSSSSISDWRRRSVTEVGPGDFVKIGRRWETIIENSAYGVQPLPRHWIVTTCSGSYTEWDINAYAKREDH